MTYSTIANQKSYPFVLPELPFDKNAFAPDFTAETFDYHYSKHHNAYVTNLNNLIEDTDYINLDLEEIIFHAHKVGKKASGVFNNASQVWNHTFFWNSIKPGSSKPTEEMSNLINSSFCSYDYFEEEFKEAAISQFGSGWVWLIYNIESKKLEIKKTANAETPIVEKLHPLLVCDVWEHAYYIDYRNRRPDYVSTFLDKMINWDFAEENLNNAIKKQNK